MGVCLRVYWKILTNATIFVVIRMITSLLIIHLYRSLPFPRQRDIWSLYVDSLYWIGFVVYPILFVVVSYFLGKNLDLKGNLRAVMISLFIGCFTGHLIGNSTIYLYAISTTANNYIDLLFSALGQSVILTVISFLIGFAGLAIGYLRKPKAMNMAQRRFRVITEM